MTLDKEWLIISTITHIKTFRPRYYRKVTTVLCGFELFGVELSMFELSQLSFGEDCLGFNYLGLKMLKTL